MIVPIRAKSQKQEKKTAKDLGGKTTIASGALVQKGDVFNEHYLVECKTTKNAFYSLKNTTWDKITKEAIKSNLRKPVMRIDLHDGAEIPESYAILPEPDFAELLRRDDGMIPTVLERVVYPEGVESIRIFPLSDYLSNLKLTICYGRLFQHSDNVKDCLIQIDWDVFVKLYKEYYNVEDE